MPTMWANYGGKFLCPHCGHLCIHTIYFIMNLYSLMCMAVHVKMMMHGPYKHIIVAVASIKNH